MPDKSVAQKLLLKPNQRAFAVNAPRGLAALLGDLPSGAKLVKAASPAADLVLLFARDRAELGVHAPAALAAVGEATLFWIAYPKKTSAVATDLSRDEGWEAIHAGGYEGVAIAAVDETWSAMRFRPKGAAVTRADRIAAGKAKPVTEKAPADLEAAMIARPPARDRFLEMPPSHRKEHVTFIEDAKRPETRAKRIEKTVEALLARPAKKK
jgi:Bacteriocin-protection, YdeI or OmpD-Associated